MRLIVRFALASFGIAALASSGAVAQKSQAPLPIEIVPNVPHSPTSIALSPRLDRLATGEYDGTVKLWDFASGRLLRTMTRHSMKVHSVIFVSEGLQVLSASEDLTIKLWDAATGRLLREAALSSPAEYMWDIKLSADGTRALTGQSEKGTDSNGIMKLWDVQTGKLLRTFRTVAHAVAFSPDGTRVFSEAPSTNYQCTGQILRMWDAATGAALRTFDGHKRCTTINRIAVSADGSRVATAAGDEVKLWDTASGRLLQSFPQPASLDALTISPDGGRVLTGDRQGVVKLWSSATGQLVHSYQKGASVDLATFTPDGAGAITWSRRLELWDVATGKSIRTYGGAREYLTLGSYTPDGAELISGGPALRRWDANSGQLRSTVTSPGKDATTQAISRDGRTILWWMPDGTLRVTDADGKVQASIEGHQKDTTKYVSAAAISSDGARILTCGYDKFVKLWDASSGKLLRSFTVADSPYAVAFSPDGSRVLGGLGDGTIKAWEASSGRGLWSYRLGTETNIVWKMQYSPDGSRILAAIGDKGPKLLDAATGRLVRSFDGHRSGYLTTVATLSPDGTRMLSASHDQTVKLWDVASGQMLRTFEIGIISWVGFSPDGKRAILNGDVWSLETGERLASIIASQGNEWLAMTPEGYFASSDKGADILSVVQGFDVYAIDQFYQSLYRPDLVREKLAGDPRGTVRAAAAKLDLTKILASGNAPMVTLVSPLEGAESRTEQIAVSAEIAERGGGIGRIEWRVNGVTLGVDEPAASSAGVQQVSRQLFLEDDENIIEVVAYNAQNLIASLPARVQVMLGSGAVRTPPKLHVLTVGVDNYWDGRLRLRWAVADAKLIASALQSAGGNLYESVNATTLTDAEVNKARLAAVFEDLSKKVRPRDVFVFFLAGHGKTVDGRYYFVPQDFRYLSENSVVDNGVSQDLWQSWFSKIMAKKSILLFDTCESGTLTAEGLAMRGLEQAAAVERLTRAMGRTVLSAATENAPALEGYEGHGLFTFAVLDALAKADTNNDGYIDMTELASYVDALVPELSSKVFGLRQVPQMKLVGSNFPFAKRMIEPAVTASGSPKQVVASKPTHVVIAQSARVFAAPGSLDAVVELAPGMTVTLIKTEGGWSLVARDGKPIGYIASKELAAIQ